MKTVRTDSQGSAGDPSLLVIRACRSSPESSSFSQALRRPHSQSAYAPYWPQEHVIMLVFTGKELPLHS